MGGTSSTNHDDDKRHQHWATIAAISANSGPGVSRHKASVDALIVRTYPGGSAHVYAGVDRIFVPTGAAVLTGAAQGARRDGIPVPALMRGARSRSLPTNSAFAKLA
jgi:hypothetical protein